MKNAFRTFGGQIQLVPSINTIQGGHTMNIAITSVKIDIEVPMHKSIIIFTDHTINQWETTFINLRDNEKNVNYKRNYDRCRALLKYAYSFWAELDNISNKSGKLVFTFKFHSIEGLTNFEKDLYRAVNGATM